MYNGGMMRAKALQKGKKWGLKTSWGIGPKFPSPDIDHVDNGHHLPGFKPRKMPPFSEQSVVH